MKDLQTLIDESGMNRRQISLATGVNYSTLTAYLNKHGAAVKSVNRGNYEALTQFFNVEGFTLGGKKVEIHDGSYKEKPEPPEPADPSLPTSEEEEALALVERMLGLEENTIVPRVYEGKVTRLTRHLAEKGLKVERDRYNENVIWREQQEENTPEAEPEVEERSAEAFEDLHDWAASQKENDPVHHPSHYTTGRIETIDIIRDVTGEAFGGYCVGNVIKYVSRYKHKNGLEDLEKARVYLGWLIEDLRR